jgi:type IV pilus assembly protein PilA
MKKGKDMQIKTTRRQRGFTIVELLIVIVIIGILAAVVIVAYTGITSKANTAAGVNEANVAINKINTYITETGAVVPTSYGSITGAASNLSYSSVGLDFTTASGTTNGPMTSKPAINDSIDFYLCGTTGTATAVSTYGGATTGINVPSGVKIGYWDNAMNSGAGGLNLTNVIGTTSGSYNGNPVNCIKVGLAEAAVSVAKALYAANTSTWPITAASINNSTGVGATLPAGEVVALVNPTSATSGVNAGNAYVKFECGSASAGAGPCLNTGGRITYWDYTAGAVASITYGAAANYWVPAT